MVHTKHISAVYHKISPPIRRDHFIISGKPPAGCRAMSHGRTFLNNHGHSAVPRGTLRRILSILYTSPYLLSRFPRKFSHPRPRAHRPH